MKWRGAVCQLQVTAQDATMWNGTGTLLNSNRVLTNHHVLFPGGAKAIDVKIQFGLESDAAGQMLASNAVQGDVATIQGDAADDWAVVFIAAPAGIDGIDLATLVATPKVASRALVLHHPGGKPKRLAFVRNRISSVDARHVYYLTDTEGGSSGSPVFDADGKLIALHRAGGTPQKFAGANPVKKNQGVRMDVIVTNILAL
jgi:V8-like Glu-specific endopeptidase